MACITIPEIQEILFARGQLDAYPPPKGKGGFFLEIKFSDPSRPRTTVDEDLKDKVITAESGFGLATIQFDSHGELRSIDLS